jgi:hypothetical protein
MLYMVWAKCEKIALPGFATPEPADMIHRCSLLGITQQALADKGMVAQGSASPLGVYALIVQLHPGWQSCQTTQRTVALPVQTTIPRIHIFKKGKIR